VIELPLFEVNKVARRGHQHQSLGNGIAHGK
jgi:hypothetical protein